MANQGSIANLKQNVNDNIYTNTSKNITGDLLNTVIQNVIDTLGLGVKDFINVNQANSQGTAYSDAATARGQVPTDAKKLGLVITYLLADGWYIDQFIGSDISGWATASNWKAIGPVNITQNTSTGHIDIKVGDNTISIPSIAEVKGLQDIYFDLTPDGNGYWSAGGTATPYETYRYKSIDISSLAGKIIRVREGYFTSQGNVVYGYGYIKLSDNSFIPITHLLIRDNILPGLYATLRLPINAVRLDISWDYGNNMFPMVAYSQLENTINPYYYRLGGFIDISGFTSGYWSAGGVETALSTYLHGTIPITSSRIGKRYVMRFGDSGGPGNWCWIKYSDNTYKKVEDVADIVNNVALLNITADMAELQISYSIADFESYLPFICEATETEYNKSLLFAIQDANPTVMGKQVFTKDITTDYITDNEEIGYYDKTGKLINDSNWKNVTISVSAGTWLRFECYAHPDIAILIERYGSKETIYRNPNITNGKPISFLFYAQKDCTLIWTYNVQSNRSGKIYGLEISQEDLKIREQVISGETPLIDPLNPEYTGKYWNANGQLQSLSQYRAWDIDVSQLNGKQLKVRVGYGTDTSAKITGWSWFRMNNDVVSPLNNYVTSFVAGQYALVTIPNGANELLISWDSQELQNPYCILDYASVLDKLVSTVEQMSDSILPFEGKHIFLFGDSISSTDYTWYKEYLEKVTGATVYNQGASGKGTAYLASNAYFARLNEYPNDIVVALVGGNDSGVSGSVGTFSADSKLAQMGESVVQETDISQDYDGNTFIQAVSHIIRKWKATYENFRLAANLNAHILDTQNNNEVVYPLSGTATESECLAYAQTQGWVLGYGERYVMMSTETAESKREKLMAVKHHKLVFCTTLPQKRYNASSYWSNPTNWERKRLAVIECCERYGIECIDLAILFAIDWSIEPYWPGQGYTGTSMTDNQGVYTMDGLHPNEFGYNWIARIIAERLEKIGNL